VGHGTCDVLHDEKRHIQRQAHDGPQSHAKAPRQARRKSHCKPNVPPPPQPPPRRLPRLALSILRPEGVRVQLQQHAQRLLLPSNREAPPPLLRVCPRAPHAGRRLRHRERSESGVGDAEQRR